MRFSYQARAKTGEIQSGVVEAANQEAASEVLKAHGLYVTALEEIVTPVYAKRLRIFERVTNKDIVLFSRQLSIMFKSRVPLVEIFQTLARQVKNNTFKEKIFKLAEEIEAGSSLSNALSLFPKLFTPFYINMVKSGEASGKLVDIFLYLADYLDREYNFRSKIKAALTYPIFIVVVFLAVASIIITFVIPQLMSVLKESDQTLPLITRIIIAATDFLRKWGWLVLLLFAGLIVLIWRFSKTATGKNFFDHNLLKVPVLGPFLKKLYLSRIALNLSTLISGGLPIIQAFEITSNVVGSNVYRDIINQTKEEIKKGETISSVLQKYPKEISPLFHQMVIVGEKTGTLDTSLTNIVDFYQADVDRALDAFIKLLEPILIIVLGVVVGGLMAAVLMPIYSTGLGGI